MPETERSPRVSRAVKRAEKKASFLLKVKQAATRYTEKGEESRNEFTKAAPKVNREYLPQYEEKEIAKGWEDDLDWIVEDDIKDLRVAQEQAEAKYRAHMQRCRDDCNEFTDNRPARLQCLKKRQKGVYNASLYADLASSIVRGRSE